MTATRAVEFVARFQPAMLGDVSGVAKLPAGNTDVIMLGKIIGIARGLSFRANPQDPSAPSIALTGVFEGEPLDPTKPLIRSTACFLPKTVHDLIVAAVRGDSTAAAPAMPARGQKVDVAGHEVRIAFNIGARKSKVTGGAGYEFVTQQIIDPTGVDPLAELKALMAPKPKEAAGETADTAAPKEHEEAAEHAGKAGKAHGKAK